MRLFSRRRFLRSGLAITVTQATGKSRNARLRIVVAGGHPGDPEYGCGGTVARYADLGHTVTLLYLNRGEKSCPETQPNRGADVRVPEARRACEILKARAVFADQCDGHAVVDPAHYDEFRVLVAAQRPDVLFTHWPVDSHADHRAISALAYDAWLKSGKTSAFYFYEVSDGEDTQMFSPTDYVDISATEARKRAACYAHASQNPDKFYALQSEVARFRGIESGFVQAEAFARHAQSVRGLLP
ncbi:MAG: PIG-L family deacetylase [Acidobacteriota bacterium]|nr:PIG-L family deacetylase [Acidobacteriota bacterium]